MLGQALVLLAAMAIGQAAAPVTRSGIERLPDGSIYCRIGGVLGLSLTVAPDRSARGHFREHQLYGGGAAHLYTTIEFTRSAAGKIAYSLGEFEIMHPEFRDGDRFGKTRVILDGATTHELNVPNMTVDKGRYSTTRRLTSDFRALGPGFLGPLGRAAEVRVQLTNAGGGTFIEMATTPRGAERMLDQLNRAEWSCG
ncbi:hypothetical protein E2493_13235 [Sphingomonas parva]|uniref:DUF3108 domain-containing protein n=1 Tax=Sphingomonas parva TaxID=2555898 RepID=A0A4Y8ZRM7_9SPHN|nr:hypothetical protein [Sphingomonas parva]TFI57785.1 hypothetical protein E2493_13235 [Sphingomonas parva]